MTTLKDHARLVMQLASRQRMTLATVESCTAGSLVRLLSEGEGASETLHGGFVVYTKENKIVSVGVPPDLLAKHTAVSAEVAQAMANGGLARSPAALVVSITGVAGPDPDEDGNPVGLVYIAVAARDGRMRVVRLDLGQQTKDEICDAAMREALSALEDLLRSQAP